MKVLFVARAIDNMAGGVERMITRVMNALIEQGHQIALFTWDQAGARSFYPMDEAITWHKLDMGDPGKKAGKSLKYRRAMRIRKIVSEFSPNAIVCFQDGPFMAMSAYTLGFGIPLIAAERNAPTRFDHTRSNKHRNLTFNSFRFAAKILIQCESYKALYPRYLHDKIITIPNPVYPAPCLANTEASSSEDRRQLLSVGRLSYQKNYSCLLEAFARIAGQVPQWDLVIIGEGEERQRLETLAIEYGIENRVMLPGNQKDINDHYASAHLFCLPSRWEGFPNALAEALAHGLPAVGFADCAGTRDLIEDGKNGILATGNGNIDSLAIALQKLMLDEHMRKTMSTLATESVRGFSPISVFSTWENVLHGVCNR